MTGTARRRAVRAAEVSAVLAVLATAASVWLYVVNRQLVSEPVRYLYGDAVAGVCSPVVGAYLVRRRPGNVVGWIFVATAVLGLDAFCNQYAVLALLGHAGSVPLGLVCAWVATWGWVPALFVPTLLPLFFPDGTLPSPRWRPYARLVVVVLTVMLLAGMFAPAPIDATDAIRNPLGRAVPGWASHVLTVPAVLSIFVLTPISVTALLLRLRKAAGRERAQLAWLSFAALVAVVCAAGSAAVPDPWSEAAYAAGSAAIPFGVLIAVARHQLLDIEFLLPRAVLYVVLTAVLVVAYLFAVVGVGTAAGQRVGIVAVALLALAGAAGRNRLQVLVERLLYGERRDPFAVVRRLGQRLDTARGPAEALAQLTEEVRESLRLPYLAIEPVRPGIGVVSSGSIGPAGTANLPVTVLGGAAATMVVGLRRGTTRLDDAERSVLGDVARRAGALVQAAELLEDVRSSRERIVIAREEERRRLRRDLHDGVGPQLAGMALQLDSLVGQLSGDPALSERASRLRDRMRSTVADVRRVVDDLRPPALDQLGVVGALREEAGFFRRGGAGAFVAGEPVVDVVVEGELPELPAAVEVAAYRIASEGLTNALRHASCRRCVVTLRAADGWLDVEVRDDGTGIDESVVPHLGLLTMRERAEELGGSITIESGADGTRVSVSLPLKGDR